MSLPQSRASPTISNAASSKQNLELSQNYLDIFSENLLRFPTAGPICIQFQLVLTDTFIEPPPLK